MFQPMPADVELGWPVFLRVKVLPGGIECILGRQIHPFLAVMQVMPPWLHALGQWPTRRHGGIKCRPASVPTRRLDERRAVAALADALGSSSMSCGP
jgi:hypothetical protein